MTTEEAPRFRAERINTESKWYDLFQRGVELGTWNVEKLIDEIGFEEDREIWRSLEPDERRQIRYLLSGFLDGEHEVGQDASHHLHRMMGAPCLADSETKEMYITMLTLTEHKHTQFLDIYMREVLSERDNYADLDPRRRGARVPVVQATGLGEVFEHQGLVTAKAAHTLDPVDIATAATVYHMNVEGLLARGGFYAINKLSRQAPLPLLNRAFKFVSTDEGRHLTHGVELLRELIEKEEAGLREYQGVKQAVVDALYEDAPAIADFGYMFTDGVGDPLDVDFDDLILHVGRLIDGQYNEALGLDVDYLEVVNLVSDRYEECREIDLEEEVRDHEERYRRKRGAATDGGTVETDGGTGEADGGTGETDGGTVETDGGTGEADGGTGEADGGTGEADGGTDGRDLEELSRGADFTASDEEVAEAIAATAEELDRSFEEVRDTVAYILDSTFEEGGVSTSFNESVSGASFDFDAVGADDPRLEALELYRLRQKL